MCPATMSAHVATIDVLSALVPGAHISGTDVRGAVHLVTCFGDVEAELAHDVRRSPRVAPAAVRARSQSWRGLRSELQRCSDASVSPISVSASSDAIMAAKAAHHSTCGERRTAPTSVASRTTDPPRRMLDPRGRAGSMATSPRCAPPSRMLTGVKSPWRRTVGTAARRGARPAGDHDRTARPTRPRSAPDVVRGVADASKRYATRSATG